VVAAMGEVVREAARVRLGVPVRVMARSVRVRR
jgi:hypothetical protein